MRESVRFHDRTHLVAISVEAEPLANVANLPIAIYPGRLIGQVSFCRLTGRAEHPYGSAERLPVWKGLGASSLHPVAFDHDADALGGCGSGTLGSALAGLLTGLEPLPIGTGDTPAWLTSLLRSAGPMSPRWGFGITTFWPPRIMYECLPPITGPSKPRLRRRLTRMARLMVVTLGHQPPSRMPAKPGMSSSPSASFRIAHPTRTS